MHAEMNGHSSMSFFKMWLIWLMGMWRRGLGEGAWGSGGNQSLQFCSFYHQRLLKGHANQLHLYCQVRMHDIFFHLALAEQV